MAQFTNFHKAIEVSYVTNVLWILDATTFSLFVTKSHVVKSGWRQENVSFLLRLATYRIRLDFCHMFLAGASRNAATPFLRVVKKVPIIPNLESMKTPSLTFASLLYQRHVLIPNYFSNVSQNVPKYILKKKNMYSMNLSWSQYWLLTRYYFKAWN